MASTSCLALLRGINVGGNHVIKMTDLKTCFESLGLRDVATFIQSGNVVFTAPAGDMDKLAAKIEQALEKRYGFAVPTVLVPGAQLRHAVEKAPKGFGTKPTEYRYDVIFLRKPLTPAEAMKALSLKEGVDTAHAGKDALYFSRLESRRTQSHLSKLMGKAAYRHMTIRNWNTTTKLLAMIDAK